jgi:predicted NBD/HSP70 family sugar kinase
VEQSASSAQRVLSYLLEQQEPVTRPSIAAALALSRPTVFAAVDRLQVAGLVEEVGQLSGKPGRSAMLCQVGLSAGLLAAIDIGGSNVRVAISDARGRLLAEGREPTTVGGGENIVKQVATLSTSALGSVDGRLRTVAVSVPGVVGADASTVYFASNIDQTAPFDFRTPLSQLLKAPVILENNVNLAAMGEQWRGAGRDLSTFAVVAVGAGIGAGIVHEGQVVRGAHRAAGEIAFLPPPGGRRVDPAVHDEAGGLRLLEDARTGAGWPDPPPASVEELFQRAADGVEVAVALVERECQRIAAVNAAICAVIDPEAIILTGGLGANAQLITRVQELTTEMTVFPPDVIPSGLGARASLIGAVCLAKEAAKAELMRAVAE